MKKLLIATLMSTLATGAMAAPGHFDMTQWGANRGYVDAPYSRYEADTNYCETNGEQLEQTDNQLNVWSEASNQQAVKLTAAGQYVRWTNDTGEADAVTIRYSLPYKGSAVIGVFQNGQEIGRANINTDHFWQWNRSIQGFRDDKPEYYSVHEKTSTHTWARMRFNDVMFRLNRRITPGQDFEIRLIEGQEATIDFVEIEKAYHFTEADARAAGMAVLTGTDIQNFIYQNQGKTVYIPEGEYKLDQIRIPDNVNLQGAGMFYTKLTVNRGMDSWSTAFVRDIHFMCTINQRYPGTDGSQITSDVKCFNGNGGGHGMVVERVCVENFTCGGWFDNYDGATFRHCRIRNNYADGINFCNGSKNGTIENCNFRNNGDDDIASWTYQGQSTGHKISNNTCEHNWRASSLGWFGGGNHSVKNMLIKDGMEIGVRMVSDFPGNGYIGTCTFDNIAIVHQGSIAGKLGQSGDFWGVDEGALHFEATETYDITNMDFSNVDIYDSRGNAVFVGGRKKAITGLKLTGVNVHGVRDAGSYAYYFERAEGNGTMTDCHAYGILPKQLTNFDTNLTLADGTYSFSDQGKTFRLSINNSGWTTEAAIPGGLNFGITALSWNPVEGNPGDELNAGDNVEIKAVVVNHGSAVSAGVPVIIRIMMDGKQATMITFEDAWGAGEAKILTMPWKATGGYHTMVAELDPYRVLGDGVNQEESTRTKRFNVNGDAWAYTLAPDPEVKEVQILDLVWSLDQGQTWGHAPLKSGDNVLWGAYIYNGTGNMLRGKMGTQYRFNGENYAVGNPCWTDNVSKMNKDETILFKANGGKSGMYMNIGGTDSNGQPFKTLSVVCNDDPASNPTYKKTIIRNFDFDLPYTGKTETGEADDPDDLDTTPVDPETMFDLELVALNWTPGDKEIAAGRTISDFSVEIKNVSAYDMESGDVRVSLYVDGTKIGEASISNLSLEAGESRTIDITGSFEALIGKHTVKASFPKVKGESDSKNNSRERTFNATGEKPGPIEPAHFAVNEDGNPGCDFSIEKIEWYKDGGSIDDPIVDGDKVRFKAYVKNVSASNDRAIKHGIQYQIPVGQNASLWCDSWTSATSVGQVMELVTNGGNAGPGVWTAKAGTTKVMAWFNDTFDLGNWHCQFTFDVKIGAEIPEDPEYFENPTGADNLGSGISNVENAVPADNVWYNLQGIRVAQPTTPGIYIRNGKKILVN